MVSWVITLLIGAVMIWMPERYSWGGFSRFIQFLLIVLILQLALLHLRLYTKAFRRHVTAFTQIVAIVTIALVDRTRRPARRAPHARRVGRLPRPVLALRRRGHDPRRGRHGADPARQRAVRSQEAATAAYLDPPAVAPAAGAAALADLRRRGDPASGDAGRLTGLERVLHGLPVAGLAGDRAGRAHRGARAAAGTSSRRARRPARSGYEGFPPPPPLPPRP